MKVVNLASVTFMKELDTLEKKLNPFPIYEEFRKHSPVRYDQERNCWDIFLYEDVDYVLKHYELFSSEQQRLIRRDNMLRMDPPRHKQLRDLVNKGFTPRAIKELAPRIQEITEQLISNVLDQGEMKMIDDMAMPLPVIVIADLLGVPAEDREKFKVWSDILVKGVEDPQPEVYEAVKREQEDVHQQLKEYLSYILERRRFHPQDDIISSLLSAEIDGNKLTETEILDFSILLLAAGNETTTNLITNGVRLMTEIPDIQRQAKSDLSLIPSMVEEVLRYYSPVQAPSRIAKQDIELQGESIKKGDIVVAWVGSANRDEAKFPAANTFQIDRKPNQHLSFGKGIHFCLGAPLARLEAQIAFEKMFTHFTNIRLKEAAQIKRTPAPQMFGVVEFPITFSL
ncbi:cytochrome P450 [Bacillus ginsengihumi]|uniref:Cytochrome P450 n=2 Tax=Heyndrickxia ginsengihumi TaxID=363870 RepID=A0A6M0P915_9BACI|nr:cytochrome P450 [Heyndrickxia ginsengihumi]